MYQLHVDDVVETRSRKAQSELLGSPEPVTLTIKSSQICKRGELAGEFEKCLCTTSAFLSLWLFSWWEVKMPVYPKLLARKTEA